MKLIDAERTWMRLHEAGGCDADGAWSQGYDAGIDVAIRIIESEPTVGMEAAMGLDKAILHGKEHRKPYKGGKRVSRRCRNHGGCCWWCKENRLYQTQKQLEKMRMRRNEEEV